MSMIAVARSYGAVLGGSSHLVSGLVHPNYKWINPTYPIYNWGYNPLTKWDEPPSRSSAHEDFQGFSSARSITRAAVEIVLSWHIRISKQAMMAHGQCVTGWWF